jgi:hypothetical protein
VKKPFPVEKIKAALMAIEQETTVNQKQMLMTH